jgi:hypothetical protein
MQHRHHRLDPSHHAMTAELHAAPRCIKTECGRAKYAALAARSGPLARLRLGWFVLIAALRDRHLSDPDGGLNPRRSAD